MNPRGIRCSLPSVSNQLADREESTSPRAQLLERRIVDMLATRAGDATMCPSEVARAEGGEHWRERMEPVREAARRLVAKGEVEILQGGHVVDPATAKGPIRLRLRR